MCNIRESKKIAIVNRNCCKRKRRNYIESLVSILKAGLGATVVFTEYAGHATDIARDLSDHDIIIAAGGDGIISEIVNGMNLENQALGIIPLGVGNSLARDLGIRPWIPAQAINIIKKNRLINIDIISCQFKIRGKSFKRFAIATSGIGFASKIATFANQYLKPTGAFCYPLSACFSLFGRRLISAKIQIDNFPVKKMGFTNFIINNTKHSGNLCVFPEANPRDSKLNLLFLRANAFTQHLWNLGIITKTYFYYPGMKKTVNKLNIMLSDPSFLMLDGEILGPVDEVTYSVLPQRLRLLS